jgi:hypothetical protein
MTISAQRNFQAIKLGVTGEMNIKIKRAYEQPRKYDGGAYPRGQALAAGSN